MSVSFEIEGNNIEDLLKIHQDTIMKEFMDDWADAVLFEAKRLLRSGKIENSNDPFGGGAFDRGNLYKSGLIIRVNRNTRVVQFTAPHAVYIEYGTLPHHPPVKPLQEWARRNKIKNWKNVGWAIAKKIAKHGTPPKPFLRQASLTIHTQIKDIFQKTMKRLR